jgi:mono/diheme cytochrome c family protein
MTKAAIYIAGVFIAALTVAVADASPQGQSGGKGQRPEPPSGNVENGKKIYTKYGCYQCHGYEAQGGPGPKLGPDAIAFDAFVRITRRPPNQMPPYTEKVVTDQELADIYAFVKSLPPPPKPESIPLLQPSDR